MQRTFHRQRLTVHAEFAEGFYTPAEIDGLTISGIAFTKAASVTPMAIRDVPPRIFSEMLRDLDLVVSVAHRGGVDPEATHSTVEMRAALLRESSQLLGITNIRFERDCAIIKGELGEYALHLGSGTIPRFPEARSGSSPSLASIADGSSSYSSTTTPRPQRSST